jgi:preprotein translocase subunit SecD
MNRSACLLAAWLVIGSGVAGWAQDKVRPPPKRVPDGVYAVLRENAKEKDLLPLKDGEVLLVDRQRYQSKDAKVPPRFLVVHAAPEVTLDLAAKPKADKDGDEIVRILLTLRPKAATALERLTGQRIGKHVAIVVGGEVVTVHQVRAAIRGGQVQITCCAPGSAKHLLEQLLALERSHSP